MSINDCPHCGKPAIGFFSKMVLGPALTRKCRSCGKSISVPWNSISTSLPIIAGVIIAGVWGVSEAAFWLILVLAFVLSAALHWYYAPLVPR